MRNENQTQNSKLSLSKFIHTIKFVFFLFTILPNYSFSQLCAFAISPVNNYVDLSLINNIDLSFTVNGSPDHTNLPPGQTISFDLDFYLVNQCSNDEIFIESTSIVFSGLCIGIGGSGDWIFLPQVNSDRSNIQNRQFAYNLTFPIVPSGNYFLRTKTNNLSQFTTAPRSTLSIANLDVNNVQQSCTSFFGISNPNEPDLYLSNQNCTTDNIAYVINSSIPPGAPIIYDYTGLTVIDHPSDILEDFDQDGVIRINGTVLFGGIDANGNPTGVNYTLSNKTFEFLDYNNPFPYPNATDNNTTLPKSGFFVNQKSELTLNNVILSSSSPCGNMWQGIKVLGHQNNRSLGGKLFLNNSIIENAHIGINLGDYRESQPGDNLVYLLNGLIEAKNSTFRNNNISINFADSHSEDIPSLITECNFECTSPLVDLGRYNGAGSSVFVNMINTRSLPIKACTFTGFAGLNPLSRGTAIRSYDANFRLTSGYVGIPLVPNTFTDLTKGIDIYSTGSLTNVVQIKDNRFNRVFQGITANNSNFDEISYNQFNIPEGNSALNSWGINLHACSGFLTTENTFTSLSTSDYTYTYGVIARNISVTNGDIYKNIFNGDFQAATQSEQKNNLLQIKCNQYLGNNRYDWAITSGELANQGVCDNDESPAGNVFGFCSSNDESQIFKSSLVPSFFYRSHTDLIPNSNCISSGTNLNDCSIFSTIASCPVVVDLPAGFIIGNGNGNAGGQGKGNANGLSNAEYKQLRAKKIRQDLQAGNLNAVLALIQNSIDPHDLRLLVPTYLALGDCVKARQKLNLIDRTESEGLDFYNLHNVTVTACENGRKIKELTDNELNLITEIETNSQNRVKTNAESILAYKNENQYLKYAERIASNTAIGLNNQMNEMQEVDATFEVYPNPSEGKIIIKAIKNETGKIIISDALGRVHFESKISNKEAILTTLETGIYIIHFTDELGFSETKQVFIQK